MLVSVTAAIAVRRIGPAMQMLPARWGNGAPDSSQLEALFFHLTPDSLRSLEVVFGPFPGSAATIGRALLRRLAHRVLGKRETWASCGADALEAHALPEPLRQRLVSRYGGAPPRTWRDALDRLEVLAGGSKARLWELVDAHPICEYVPCQCAHCEPVPDKTNPDEADEVVGIREVAPTEAEQPYVRAGFFRGPRGRVVFEITCHACGRQSRWWRSSSPRVLLRPERWGRLCGEQEDLKAWLAERLGVRLRVIAPLDWDHVWSEVWSDAADAEATSGEDTPKRGHGGGGSPEGGGGAWLALDGMARNFAARLDEGIGSWTRVLAIAPDPADCADVTDEYLRCRGRGGGEAAANGGAAQREGRADPHLGASMPTWRGVVRAATADSTGRATQAGSLNGYVLRHARLSAAEVTEILQGAAEDFHRGVPWWAGLGLEGELNSQS